MQVRIPEMFGHSSAIPSGNEPAAADLRPRDKIPQPKVRDTTQHDQRFLKTVDEVAANVARDGTREILDLVG
jgi:hypothetical protein